ncbi:ABC transporter transmembrane domain-containing protein [Natronoglycomyces albus]|uniref:ABC transporter ATP-binding protein n=1 Tax=Natronoglycomyces albus TaxID=2811108 RepID=A0A895XT64_9ACTN|nr:ABC transporter ATP-binding protein [Natronoglycomyces albus]QSB06683.1 ABC transporter ATP-binding protein [Natronoglycomyces albus]
MQLLAPLPTSEPGNPPRSSALSLMGWIYLKQWRTLSLSALSGLLWMGLFASMPFVIGRAIDQGISEGIGPSLWIWGAVFLGLAYCAWQFTYWMTYLDFYNSTAMGMRVVQLINRHAGHTGAALPTKISTGEVVAAGNIDARSIGESCFFLARAVGGIVFFLVVAAIMYRITPLLGLVVLSGLLLQAIVLGPLLSPLQKRVLRYREQEGHLTALAQDIVAGLRVLRGIGGEAHMSQRYRDQSAQLRHYGNRSATAFATISGLEAFVPGLLLVAVIWVASAEAINGALSPGQLVATFGYAAFLWLPMVIFSIIATRGTVAYAAAKRVVRTLQVQPAIDDSHDGPPVEPGALVDPDSGFEARNGAFTALTGTNAADLADICDRLARYTDTNASLGHRRLDEYRLDEVRAHVLLATNELALFPGTLRQAIDPSGTSSDAEILAALHVAAAQDAIDSVGGLNGDIAPGGRNLSGGQQQRLKLARALVANPPVLILLGPTTAMDSSTEALVAQRLRAFRQDQTTIVVTSSPVLLDAADTVAFMVEAHLKDTGTHRTLWATNPSYRHLIDRTHHTTPPAVEDSEDQNR